MLAIDMESAYSCVIDTCGNSWSATVDKHELRKSMASALRRHHDVGAEANYIINTYLDDSIKEKKYEDS